MKINGVEVNCTRKNAIQWKIENVRVVGGRCCLAFKIKHMNTICYYFGAEVHCSSRHSITLYPKGNYCT